MPGIKDTSRHRSFSADEFWWILWGVVMAVIKLIYSFFPFSTILDVIIFGIAGAYIQRRYKKIFLLSSLFLILPSILLCLYFVFFLGWNKISEGIGTAWLVSLLIIPVSVFFGSFLQKRKERRP